MTQQTNGNENRVRHHSAVDRVLVVGPALGSAHAEAAPEALAFRADVGP